MTTRHLTDTIEETMFYVYENEQPRHPTDDTNPLAGRFATLDEALDRAATLPLACVVAGRPTGDVVRYTQYGDPDMAQRRAIR